jgi:hypothetical protein
VRSPPSDFELNARRSNATRAERAIPYPLPVLLAHHHVLALHPCMREASMHSHSSRCSLFPRSCSPQRAVIDRSACHLLSTGLILG